MKVLELDHHQQGAAEVKTEVKDRMVGVSRRSCLQEKEQVS